MAILLTLDRKVMRTMCAYGPQSGTPDTEKEHFYDEMVSEWDLRSSSEIIVSLGDFNKHVGKCAEDFGGVHEGGIGKGTVLQKEKDCWSSVMKKSCEWQTLGFMRWTKGKSLIVLVGVKQKLILSLRESNIESM